MDNDPKPLVWDCGSSLYDSFELKSFMHQLDSAIAGRAAARCMSMPHHFSSPSSSSSSSPSPSTAASLPPLPPPPQAPAACRRKQRYSKLSQSIQRLLRSVFRLGGRSMFRVQVQSHGHYDGGGHALYYAGACSRSGRRLESIPEVCEKEAASPDMDYATVRKAASERFSVPAMMS